MTTPPPEPSRRGRARAALKRMEDLYDWFYFAVLMRVPGGGCVVGLLVLLVFLVIGVPAATYNTVKDVLRRGPRTP